MNTQGDVMVGYIDYGQWVPEFGESLVDFFLHDALGSRRVGGRCRVKGPYIPENRTRLCREFLAGPCQWLWMLDIDLAFPPQILDALLDAAHPTDKPIVGALYFSSYESTPAGTWWPMWLERQGDQELCVVSKVELGAVRELSVAGTGCMVIHRSVIEKLAEVHAEDPWPWFGHDVRRNPVPSRAGEDVTFCSRARAAGFTVWGLAVPLRHFKTISVGWDTFAAQFAKEDTDVVPERMLHIPSGPLPVDPFRNRAARRREPQGRRAL